MSIERRHFQPVTEIWRSRSYLTLTVSATIRDTDILYVIMEYFFLSYASLRVVNHNWSVVSHETASPCAECSWDKPRHSVLSGDMIRQCGTWSVSRHKDRLVSISRHYLLQAPQCPCSMRKRLSRDHCFIGRSKPGCRIVGSHTRWELTTWADFKLFIHRLLMSVVATVG